MKAVRWKNWPFRLYATGRNLRPVGRDPSLLREGSSGTIHPPSRHGLCRHLYTRYRYAAGLPPDVREHLQRAILSAGKGKLAEAQSALRKGSTAQSKPFWRPVLVGRDCLSAWPEPAWH